VVGVGVGDDGPFGGLPRVDVEVAGGAEESAVVGGEEILAA
jgi:hypothetical protein